ncbi:type VI secretion system membrane subunit TssM [Chitinibacter fontanus]|uniref:Type VI secretion system membrane subunit TssM n=1 Tax=Chitinibacter fontanus TaxID=1737446 RepID=A0A7D5V9Q9_9NEIS|nr:type VI secretion system membrane subunit TssM [Chitinibacter fontanus]QLI81292.1 type VI secretion system membrane subunit TssM [Chitinibacter fontanus]
MKHWLRNAKVTSAIGFLILIALIWFLGPWMGLESLESRFGWILGVMLLWVVTLLIGNVIASRAGSVIEKMLTKQADDAVIGASADKRAEVNLLRQRMLGAIDTLKTSQLGKARGNAALYELPWYMIIGHPAAGKSSAILQSGLTFPFSDKSGIQGVGGTRNCDWFFSTEGVLLDTAGRYATQSEDRVEWLEFLKLLKRHRSKAPVNGILVTISLPELAQHQSEGFALYARQIRERIHEIEDVFGLQVPIYLIFTKLDLLGGFAQFFESMSDAERNGVWGSTLSAEQGSGFDASHVVAMQFDEMYRGLMQMGEEKLAEHRGNQNKPAFFAFPIEFHALKEAVSKFVKLLQEDDPYHARPLLRGFYFSSALQEGTPRIGAAARVSSQFDLSRSGFDARQAPASYSYFLRDLFRDVIFPDQHLVSRQTRPAGSRWRLAGMLAGLSALALCAGLWTWSYIGNQKLMASVSADRAAAQKLVATGQVYDKLQALGVLQKRIEELQSYRRNGHPWQIGMGLYQGKEIEVALRKEYFDGLQQVMLQPVKKNLEESLLQLAANKPVEVIQPAATPAPTAAPVTTTVPVKPAPKKHAPKPKSNGLPNVVISAAQVPQRATAAQANQPAAASPAPARLDQGYNALKTYLMLSDRSRMDEAHLTDQIPRYWRAWLEANKGNRSNEEMAAAAERLVAFYVSQIKEPDLPLIQNNGKTVSEAREVLRASLKRLSATERVYNEIKARANTRFAPLTVPRILANKNGDVIAGSQMVAGAFTREAWDQFVRASIEEASKGEVKSDDWVLASSSHDNLGKDGNYEKNKAELEALYRQEYAAEWRKFLQGVVIRDFNTIPTAGNGIAQLADTQNSPVKLILARAAFETAWDNPSELSRKIENAKQSMLEKTTEFIKGNSQPKTANVAELGEVGKQFAGLARLVQADSVGVAPINAYFEQLGKLKGKMNQIASSDQPGAQALPLVQATLNGSGSELADTLQMVDNTLLSQVSPETREMVRPMLVRPLIQTYATLLSPVEQDLNAAWQREVYGQWKTLSAKYPFSDSANEAPMADIAKFIKPDEGTVDKFTDKYLNGLVVQKGDTMTPRTWANLGIRFNPTFLVGVGRLNALASSQMMDSANIKFELQPIPTPGISEIRLDIDGQELRYRNGPQPWQTFNWPGNGNTQGARIQVVAFNGASSVVSSQQGRMGWMRLIAQAQVEQQDADSAVLVWKNKNSADEVIRFNFRVVSGVNPLQLSGLRKLSLPDRVTM